MQLFAIFNSCIYYSVLLLNLQVKGGDRQIGFNEFQRAVEEFHRNIRLHPTGFREIYIFPTRKDRSFNGQERITTPSTLISPGDMIFIFCSCLVLNTVPGFLVKLLIGLYIKSLI